VKNVALGFVLFCLCEAGFGQTQGALCPRHIETPEYPQVARIAHLTGKITLTVTIDADGNVKQVEGAGANSAEQQHPMLRKYAVENMKHWTFVKPPSAPYTFVFDYDFEFDESLPGEGGPHSLPSITKVNFDLPDRVTILSNLSFVETSRAHN
jgi:TonB family protein